MTVLRGRSNIIPHFERLSGKKVFLQTFLHCDISSEYISWLNDPEVMRYSKHRSRIHTQETCVEYLSSFENSPNRFLKIIDRLDNRMIGTLTVYLARERDIADIGIMIGCRKAWGSGIGFDAWATISDWLLEHTPITKITGGAMKKNIPMVKIMLKSGMALESSKTIDYPPCGCPEEVLFFGKSCDKV